MVQRKRKSRKASTSNGKCRPNRRSLPKRNYKEDRDTQSGKSDYDDDDDDDDFEPLKKYATNTKKRDLLSKENNQTKKGSEMNKQFGDFSLDISRPKLSDSESSDEEVYIKEVDLKPNPKVKLERLKPNEVKWSKETTLDTAGLSDRKAMTSEYDNICAMKGTTRHIKLSHPKETCMEVDDNFIRDKSPNSYGCKSQLCNDERVETSPLEDIIHNELVSEKTEKNVRKLDNHLAGNKIREKVKTEPQGKRKTRAGLKRQKNSDNKSEHEVSNQNVRTKKDKQVAKTISKGKRGKVIEQNQNQEKFLQNLPSSSKMNNRSEDSDSDESENEWEEVHELTVGKSVHESPRKKVKLDHDIKDISINLKVKSIHKSKGQKNKEKFLQCVERTMRKFQNQQQTNLHKCHLICLVARMQWINGICNNQTIKAVCMSLIPNGFSTLSNTKWDLMQLRRFVNWFSNGVLDVEALEDTYGKISGNFRKITRLQIFIAALRTMGLLTRLVMSLQPMSWKVENSELFRLKTDNKKEAIEGKVRSKSPVQHFERDAGIEAKKSDGKNAKSLNRGTKPKGGKVTSPYFEHTSESEIKKELEEKEGNRKREEKLPPGSKTLKRKVGSKNKAEISKVNRDTKPDKKVSTPSRSVRRKGKQVSYKETTTGNSEDETCKDEDSEAYDDDIDDKEDNHGEDYESDDDDFIETPKRSLSSKLSQRLKQNSCKRERKSCMPSVERGYARKLVKTIDNDVEFQKTSKPVKRRRSVNDIRNSPTVQVISSDSESSHSKDRLDMEDQSNSCINIINCAVDDVTKCEKLATQPLQYVLGVDNQNAIKDVTCRYASKFMSKTRKLRVEREWWAQTLHSYETKQKKLDAEEDTQLRMALMQQPFPTTMSEFKNHPLYVLEGDLLKFEAIYPKEPAVLGYFRNKAIYSRECVHVLHTRENWLKEARVVKQGEKAYKIVRGRPKRSTPVHERDKVKIDLFGLWQTEVYKPPPIVNGKVPRNEYGNVELFKPSMIPPGGVHIPIQGIHRTARKLGIDAAPAMMGWDFHSGCAHPIIEGVVVAVEFEEKLLDAWQKDEDERERKLKEKNEKKIVDRWKGLVKGLLVRERIRRKYDFREGEDFEYIAVSKEETPSHISISWPLNKLEGTTSVNDKGHCHIFPESSYKQDKITGEWRKSCSCGLSMPFEML